MYRYSKCEERLQVIRLSGKLSPGGGTSFLCQTFALLFQLLCSAIKERRMIQGMRIFS